MGTVPLPAVLKAPIRLDVVNFVHTNLAKNHRQPYAVSKMTGHQTSAISWGTGRAVARIPRVSGGGTGRAGQGAYGNMCRGGRMFAPTHIWRRWHRKVNVNQRRFAVASALAASAVPSLVIARGHCIDHLEEVPLVVADKLNGLTKTAAALKFLEAVGAMDDVERVKDSKALRAGVGKMRNRRYQQRRGPLVCYLEDNGITRAFRNIPGVELCNVNALNLLLLAPGGHIGRFIIWTQGAFAHLDKLFGTFTQASELKKNYLLPRSVLTNPDISRIIESDEIQAVIRPSLGSHTPKAPTKHNPLKNKEAMLALNPYSAKLRADAQSAKSSASKRQKLSKGKRQARKLFIQSLAE